MKCSTTLVALDICLPLLFAFKQPGGQQTQFFSSTKKAKTMIIEKQITIDKNIEKAWQVLGPQFAEASKWASAVSHSEGKGAGRWRAKGSSPVSRLF